MSGEATTSSIGAEEAETPFESVIFTRTESVPA
jgi:hypothetical protein